MDRDLSTVFATMQGIRHADGMKATEIDVRYPRPGLVRRSWLSLDGTWELAYDDADEGLAERWWDPGSAHAFDERIEVPFPPESPASGIGRREIHPVVWYRRRVTDDELGQRGDDRVVLHLGAVDHLARVWVDGHLVADHAGGMSPIAVDVTDSLDRDRDEHLLVVRAEDDPTDPEQARGKQDWREKTQDIWYERTTGIWQPVWAEVVPRDHVTDLAWVPDPAHGLRGTITLARRPRTPLEVEVSVTLGEEVLAGATVVTDDRVVEVDVAIAALRNGQDRARLLWSPEHPTLLDIAVRVRDVESRAVVDEVAGYTGLRTVEVSGGQFRLNGWPYYLRAVLNQGYRPHTHLASRDADELRAEVETIKAMGFNCSRNHQKSEDPRWLYWADRLGLLVWAEAAAHYGFSAAAVERFVPEWLSLVRRDRSHPSVCLWVPVNESWGVPALATDAAQRSYTQGLASLTRAVDPTRPVVSNEGWEHVDSDVLGLHDYTADPDELRERYATAASVRRVVVDGRTPHGRRPVVSIGQLRAFEAGETPVMVTEFGGISLTREGDSWGYATVGSDSEYAALLQGLFDALRASEELSGFCYTQLMDTGQETNGLLYADGSPKLPLDTIRQIVTGQKEG
jgi:beta-galactosidase/beta-glucuronidase